MAIEDRNLAVGTKLWARYKTEVYTAEVIPNPIANSLIGRPIAYRLADGREFLSPSAAGAAVMGEGRTCNGWAFWTVGEPTEKPAKPERTSRATSSSVHPAPKPERKARARKPKGETTNVPTDGNGHVLSIVEQVDGSFECGDCGATFATTDEVAAHLAEVHPA